uniref:Uncharacterized protein n=1 Tax=Parascaris equorum TaxID=6256 RepID=A0A914SHG3_PAREQ
MAIAGDADPASISRLQILLEALHKELLSTNNICIEVNDSKLWNQITSDVDPCVFSSASRFPAARSSSGASSATSLGCCASPVSQTPLSPLHVYVSHLFSRHLELHWLSEARICASEHRVHTLFNLRSYCETIEDQLFSRAFINAVYRALVEDIYVPSEDLIEATEDRCEQANIEIDGADSLIETLNYQPRGGVLTDSLLDNNEHKSVNLVDEGSCEDEQEDYSSGGVLSRSSLSDDVEFCYVGSADNDFSSIQQRINESEVESQSELLAVDSSVDVAPLFVNFSCALRFPNQTMHTFPIDHLPSCMLKLLRQCPDAPHNIAAMLDQVEVTLDIYVLSWPSVHAVNDHMDSVVETLRKIIDFIVSEQDGTREACLLYFKTGRNSVPLPAISIEDISKRKTSGVASRAGISWFCSFLSSLDDEQVFLRPSSRIRQQELNDFWLIVTVDAHEAKVYFCQRLVRSMNV